MQPFLRVSILLPGTFKTTPGRGFPVAAYIHTDAFNPQVTRYRAVDKLIRICAAHPPHDGNVRSQRNRFVRRNHNASFPLRQLMTEVRAFLSSHWRWMRGKASRYPAHTHRASPPAAARMQAGTQGLGARSIHTPYNPSTPVIIRTVAENMACHAGTTRTKKLTGHGMGHQNEQQAGGNTAPRRPTPYTPPLPPREQGQGQCGDGKQNLRQPHELVKGIQQFRNGTEAFSPGLKNGRPACSLRMQAGRIAGRQQKAGSPYGMGGPSRKKPPGRLRPFQRACSQNKNSMPREAGTWFSLVIPAANPATPIQNQEKGLS